MKNVTSKAVKAELFVMLQAVKDSRPAVTRKPIDWQAVTMVSVASIIAGITLFAAITQLF